MKQQILFELRREWMPARVLLERLPEDQLAWRPHPAARTLGELGWHMSSVLSVASTMALHTNLERSSVPWPPVEKGSAAQAAHLVRCEAAARGNIGQLSDQDLQEDLTVREGDHVMFKMPREQFLRWGLMSHFIQHRAQLGLYARILNVAVPALVGPSKDDNPFLPKQH